MEKVWVKSSAAPEPGANVKTVFYEPHPAHPNSRGHVTDQKPAEVAETPGVKAALREGLLKKATEAEIKAAKQDVREEVATPAA